MLAPPPGQPFSIQCEKEGITATARLPTPEHQEPLVGTTGYSCSGGGEKCPGCSHTVVIREIGDSGVLFAAPVPASLPQPQAPKPPDLDQVR